MDIIRRGYIPKGEIEFGSKATETLNAAAQELIFLVNRGYDTKSASTFIGNHHLLSERQRWALIRITSTGHALAERKRKELSQAPETMVLDGFNTIITLEMALSGSLLIAGMDSQNLHKNRQSLHFGGSHTINRPCSLIAEQNFGSKNNLKKIQQPFGCRIFFTQA